LSTPDAPNTGSLDRFAKQVKLSSFLMVPLFLIGFAALETSMLH
jgi:hypothetical protein